MITAFSPVNNNYKRYSAQTTPFAGRKPEVKVGKILEDFAREIPGTTEKEIPRDAYPQLSTKEIAKINLSVNTPKTKGIIPGNQRILKLEVEQTPKWGETEGTKNSTNLLIETIDGIKAQLRTNALVEKIKVAVEKLARDPSQS